MKTAFIDCAEANFHFAAEFLLAAVLVAVVALGEETIFRGYLMLRLQAVLRGSARAVLLSSVIFSVGHGYEGSAGLVTVGVMGRSSPSSIYGAGALSLRS